MGSEGGEVFRKFRSNKETTEKSPAFFFFFFLGPDIAYENSRARSHIGAAGVVYTTATATLDPNSICDLCHSLQCWILNPLREARVQTHILTDIISGS